MDNILDDYAHTNALRDVDKNLKLLLGGGCILIGITSATPITPFVIGIVLGYLIVWRARIPGTVYLKILAIPVTFSVMSCTVILFLTGGGEPLWSAMFFGYPLFITAESVNLAFLLLGRTFGGMSSLSFIALTTPVVDLFAMLRSLRLPQEFIDLSMLIYRFIFLLLGEMIVIHNAQEMRHGYSTFKNSLRSIAMLGAMLFIRSWEKGEDLVLAMDSRCYNGRLEVLEESRNMSPVAAGLVIGFLAFCTVLMALTWDVTLI